MKKIISISFVAFIALFLFVSCSKDDNSSNTSTSGLLGKWEYSQVGTIVNGQEILGPYEHESGCSKDYIEMLTSGVYKEYDYDSFVSPCNLSTGTGTWLQNGNTITISVGGDTDSAEILTLNATTLKIKAVIDTEIVIAVYNRV
jgi:hypothetical protein